MGAKTPDAAAGVGPAAAKRTEWGRAGRCRQEPCSSVPHGEVTAPPLSTLSPAGAARDRFVICSASPAVSTCFGSRSLEPRSCGRLRLRASHQAMKKHRDSPGSRPSAPSSSRCARGFEISLHPPYSPPRCSDASRALIARAPRERECAHHWLLHLTPSAREQRRSAPTVARWPLPGPARRADESVIRGRVRSHFCGKRLASSLSEDRNSAC